MADSKLKLSIVTALDNAGIKATEQQIDGMMKSIEHGSKQANSSLKGTFDGVDGSVNGMFKGVKTFLKDIAIAVGLTKTVGTAAMKVFEDVETKGKTASESIQDSFRSAADSASKFLFGTDVSSQYNKVAEEATKAANAQIAGIDAINAQLDKQKSKIDDISQRYLKQRQSVNALNKSLDESDDILYDREQLWKVEYIRATEGEEAARQAQEALQVIGTAQKYHRNIAAFDDETVALDEKLATTKKKIEETDKAYERAKAQRAAAQKLYDQSGEEAANLQNANPLGNDEGWQGKLYRAGRAFYGGWIYDMIESVGQEDMTNEIKSARSKAVSAANNALNKIEQERQKLLEQQVLDETALQKREQDRANLVSRYQHEIDKMEFAREQSRDNDAQVFYDLDRNSIDKLYDFSVETAKYQKDTAENTQELAEKLDALLQMKQ